MSSYLDFVIEKKDKDGKWKFFMKSSYEDEVIVNPYILRDVFQYNLTDVENISDFDDSKTKYIMSEKFPESRFFGKNDERYPYNKNRILHPCVVGTYAKDDILDCLKAIYEHEDDVARFSDIALRIKSHAFDKLASVEDFLNDKNVIHENGDTYYKFRTAYEAYNFVIYNIVWKNFDYKDIFDVVCLVQYIDDDRKDLPQYITNNVKVSDYDGLCKALRYLEREYEDYKTSISDENRLRKLLRELLDDDGLNCLKEKTPLAKKIKAFLRGGNINYYTQEEIEELTTQIEEMKLLVRLVGENGRVVWKISC